MSGRHILVAGDTPVDLLVYPSPADSNQTQRGQEKFRASSCNGGATLIADLLCASANEHKHQVHEPAFELPSDNSLKLSASFITELEIVGKSIKAPCTFKVTRRQQLDTTPVW